MGGKASKCGGRLTRRQFLGRTALGAVALPLAPTFVPASVLGQEAPSNRLNVGMIGMGNQSEVDLPAFLRQPDVQVVAVCDVNTGSHGYRTPEQFLGREPGRQRVNAYYAEKNKQASYKGCEAYHDFRELLARKDIDVVAVVVPDHWHALITIAAAAAGKDIYCEKPLSLCVRDGRAMVEAVQRFKRVLQTGSQWRSSPHARFACELVRNGYIGRLQRAITDVAPNNFTGPGPGWKPMPVPEGFDYDFWLGPAPWAPYHKDRCLYRFRFILDYSGGQTTNFGAHSNGLVQWAVGADNSGPVEFEDLGAEWPPPGDLFTTATKVDFRARYANGVELHCRTSQRLFGVRFEGTEGWVDVSYKGLETFPESLKSVKFGPNDIRLAPEDAESNLAVVSQSNNSFRHVRNFLDCVKSRKDPIEPVEAGHRTATLCHLGNIAMKLRRKIRWDPEKEQILDDAEASGMLERPLRQPWGEMMKQA